MSCSGSTLKLLVKSRTENVANYSFINRRFAFQQTSSIDTLLDREDVDLESILDDDDLLSECKNQNTRLIDYFQRMDVLRKLLGYASGEIEGDGMGRFK